MNLTSKGGRLWLWNVWPSWATPDCVGKGEEPKGKGKAENDRDWMVDHGGARGVPVDHCGGACECNVDQKYGGIWSCSWWWEPDLSTRSKEYPSFRLVNGANAKDGRSFLYASLQAPIVTRGGIDGEKE